MAAHHYTFFGSAYIDVAEAAGDFDQAERSLVEIGTPTPFDAAILGRKASGVARLYQNSELAPRADASEERSAPVGGLAAGLALALIPDMAVGSGVGPTVAEWLRFVAGQVTRAAGRSIVRDFGDFIDQADAALVVAVLSDVAGPVRTVLEPGRTSIEMSTSIDVDLLHVTFVDFLGTSR